MQTVKESQTLYMYFLHRSSRQGLMLASVLGDVLTVSLLFCMHGPTCIQPVGPLMVSINGHVQSQYETLSLTHKGHSLLILGSQTSCMPVKNKTVAVEGPNGML